MPIALDGNRRTLVEAHFTRRKPDPRSIHSLCDCLMIDPCGCIVDPQVCFKRDTAGCFQDCPCQRVRPAGRPETALGLPSAVAALSLQGRRSPTIEG